MPPFCTLHFLTSEGIKLIGISVFALVQYLPHKMKGTWGLEQELRHASGIHWVYLKLCNKSNQRGLCAAEVAANLPWNQWFRAVAVCCLQMVSVKREGRKGGRKRKREGKIHHLGKDRLKRSGFLTISMPVLFFLSLIAKKNLIAFSNALHAESLWNGCLYWDGHSWSELRGSKCLFTALKYSNLTSQSICTLPEVSLMTINLGS